MDLKNSNIVFLIDASIYVATTVKFRNNLLSDLYESTTLYELKVAVSENTVV